MRSTCTTLLLAAVIAATSAGAVDSGEAAPSVVEWRRVGDTPGFPDLAGALRRVVGQAGGKRAAVFCVVLRDDGRDPIAYALWPQANRLYRWRATRDARLDDATLINHQPLNLRRDLVRSPEDGLSTYKVTRAWVDDVSRQCRDHGEQVPVAEQRR